MGKPEIVYTSEEAIYCPRAEKILADLGYPPNTYQIVVDARKNFTGIIERRKPNLFIPAGSLDKPHSKEPEFTAADGTVRKSHYGSGEQPWDEMVKLGIAFEFALGCILKYLGRDAAIKGSDRVDDNKKAAWYGRRVRELLNIEEPDTPKARHMQNLFRRIFYGGKLSEVQRDYLLVYGTSTEQECALLREMGVIVDHETGTVYREEKRI